MKKQGRSRKTIRMYLIGILVLFIGMTVGQGVALAATPPLAWVDVLHIKSVKVQQEKASIIACPARFYKPDGDKMNLEVSEPLDYPEAYRLEDFGDEREIVLDVSVWMEWNSINEASDGKAVRLVDAVALSKQIQRGYVAWKPVFRGNEITSLTSLPLRIRNVYSISGLEVDDYDASMRVQPACLIEYPALEDNHYSFVTSETKSRLFLDQRVRIGVQFYYWKFNNADYSGYDISKLEESMDGMDGDEHLAELEIGSNRVIRSIYVIYEP